MVEALHKVFKSVHTPFEQSLIISRVLHACYVIDSNDFDDTKLIFDPIFENPFSVNCYAFPDVKFEFSEIKIVNFSAVFISHYHDDHFSMESLNLLDRNIPIYVYCQYEEIFELIKRLGFTEVHSLVLDKTVTIGSFKVTPRKAFDSDVDCLFQIQKGSINILNVVDSWIDESTLNQLKQLAPWDLILWPFQTMREVDSLAPCRASPPSEELPPEWIEQLKILMPKAIIPSSCQFIHEENSWLRHYFFPISYKQFEKQICEDLPTTKVFKLNPSESLFLTEESIKPTTPLSWLTPQGHQDTDYHYDPNTWIPSTLEVSALLPPIEPEQTEQVLQYCNSEILFRLNQVGPPDDEYFSTPRVWRLKIYEPSGKTYIFNYSLHNGRLDLAPQSDIFHWITEIPMQKIYGALYKGESLSSLYIRINDQFFTKDIEQELQEADILSDPLLRCLYHNRVGSYQIAQLQKLGLIT